MKKLIVVLAILVAMATSLNAETFKVALKDIPSAKHYEALLVEIGAVTGNTFEVQRYPQFRALYMLEEGQVDMEAPEISPPQGNTDNKIILSKTEIGRIAFVLYAAKYMTPADAKALSVDTSNLKLIGVPAKGTSSVIGSLKSVSEGLLYDGYVAAQTVGDPVLAKMPELKIVKNFFAEYPIVFGLSKNGKAEQIEKILADGIAKLKKSGKYAEIMGPFLATAKFSKDIVTSK